MNYRDSIAMAIVGSFFASKALTYWGKTSDMNFILVSAIEIHLP
jgi:hypothetical protein